MTLPLGHERRFDALSVRVALGPSSGRLELLRHRRAAVGFVQFPALAAARFAHAQGLLAEAALDGGLGALAMEALAPDAARGRHLT